MWFVLVPLADGVPSPKSQEYDLSGLGDFAVNAIAVPAEACVVETAKSAEFSPSVLTIESIAVVSAASLYPSPPGR